MLPTSAKVAPIALASGPRKLRGCIGSVISVRSEDIERSQSGDVMKLGWQCAGMTWELL
jgi:hypothetical protein